MGNKFHRFIQALNKRLVLHMTISFGIFLFILFFQPFPLERFDFDDRLLFVAGFAGIVFLIMTLTRAVRLSTAHDDSHYGDEYILASFLSGFIILTLCSVAFAFYLRYVGSVGISFFIMFRVILICLVPPVILKVYDLFRDLMQQNRKLVAEKKLIREQIVKYEEDNLNKSVEFVSETGSENLKLMVADVIFMQSADNYVQIAYQDGETIKKKLIRNTLKNTELQIRQYSGFIRCHRTCIVNMHYIEKLHRDYGNHWITLKGYGERIPVSRQYLLKLREAI
jgi:hypothetical protein